MLVFVYRDRGEERRRGHVDLDAVGLGQILHAMQFFYRGVETSIRDDWIAADIAYAIASEILQVLIVGRSGLAAKLHQNRFFRRLLRGWRGERNDRVERKRCGCGRGGEKLPAGELRHECLLA